MDTNMLKYQCFVKAVECGSFTKAAEILNYSQSSISRMIRDLEQELHITLLERRKSGVQLTSDGLKILPHAQKICQDFDTMQTFIDDLTGLQSGIIRIGTFSSVSKQWLPKIITEFRKIYPNIEYELLFGDYKEIEEWILSGRVDCGFLRLPANPLLDTFLLDRDPLLAVLPEKHPLANEDFIPLDAFTKEPFILLAKNTNTEIMEIFKKNDIIPNTQFTTWDDQTIMSMVETGLGISILHQMILMRTPYHIITKRLQTEAFRDIGFAVRNQKTAPLVVQRFTEYLKYRNW